MLANLRRRDTAGGQSWWQWLWSSRKTAGRRSKSATAGALTADKKTVLGAEYSVLHAAPDLLWQRRKDIGQLKRFAAAAGAFDFDEVELRYLYAARELVPDDVDTLRMLARGLTRQGRFEDALGPWCAVLALKAGDNEATRAIEDLGPGRQGDQHVSSREEASWSDAGALMHQAQLLQDAGDFATAEKFLAQAQAASGADMSVLVLREDLRIRHSEQRLGIARRRAANDSHPRAQQLVPRLADEHNRMEIEILNARAERSPGDALVRIELAQRLRQAGNFSGAIQKLEEVLRLKPDEPSALLELGECWQHLRQFAKALEFYGRAAAKLENSSDELYKRTHYRGGVLASALGQNAAARDHFRAVVAADAAYKDARERLDKLGPN